MKGHVVHFSLTDDWKIYNVKDAGLAEDAEIGSLSLEDGTLTVTVGDALFDLNDDGSWVPIPIKYPLPQGLTVNQILLITDDGRQGYWCVGYDLRLWHRDIDKKWTAYPDTSTYPFVTLPYGGEVPDGQGGIWVGTMGEGLVHLTSEGQWETSATPSKLPLSSIYGISYDANGGGWLLGFQMYASVTHSIESPMKLIRCQPENSELNCDLTVQNLPPEITDENIQMPKLLTDDKGGLWLSSNGVGLFHRSLEGQWTTYDTSNSELPSNEVFSIVDDLNGGLWISTKSGLAHLSQDQTWTVYTTGNSGLPSDNIFALETDLAGGLWIGFSDDVGLAHFSSQGEWTVYTTDNSPLPNNNVTALLKGENGGLWVGTAREKNNGGLGQLSQ